MPNRRYRSAPPAPGDESFAPEFATSFHMSRFLKSLSSLMNGNAGRSSDRDVPADASEPDAGPSTLTTPLFPLNGSDADAPSAPQRPARRHATTGARSTST